MIANTFWLHVIQGCIYLALAPLVIGLLRWAKARLQRRQGPSWFQFYRDLYKLLTKEPVVPAGAPWAFSLTPTLVFTCYAALGFLVPVFYLPESSAWLVSDLLLLVYILGLARLILGLAGMSAGAPFGGLGSSRELFIHVLAEPTLILIVCTLALKWHTTDLSAIFWKHYEAGWLGVYTSPSLLFLFLALALVTLAEAGRLPFDNPATHLELTMFGKAIQLEVAGPGLALLEWAEALRLTFLLVMLSNLAMPRLMAVATQSLFTNLALALLCLAKLIIPVLLLAIWESMQIKARLRAIMAPVSAPLVLTFIAAMLAIVERFTWK